LIVGGVDSRPDSPSVRSLELRFSATFYTISVLTSAEASQTVCRLSSRNELVDDVLQILFACTLFIPNQASLRIPKTNRHQVRRVLGILQSGDTAAFTHRLRKCRARHKCRVQAGIIQYLKDPTISPILTSTLIAAGTVSFNLVAGLVTEKQRADLQLEVQGVLPICWLFILTRLPPKPTLQLCRLSNSEILRKLSKNCNR